MTTYTQKHFDRLVGAVNELPNREEIKQALRVDPIQEMRVRLDQFQFCIDRVAEALGNVVCGGVDSSPEEQLADSHSTTRVLCDAIEKLKRKVEDNKVRSKEAVRAQYIADANAAAYHGDIDGDFNY